MTTRRCLLLGLLCGGWLWSQPIAAEAQISSGNSRGGFSLGNVTGVFTVSDFRAVNGTSMAAGWLTAHVTDPTGTNEVGMFTNFPVRLPVSGVLAGNPIDSGTIDDPVILPQLGTNTCSLLGMVVGPIDLTVLGLGLNLHVNQISAVVRGDRETTVGDLLCTLLGDDLLGAAPEGSPTQDGLTVEQLRGLMGILLGPGISGAGSPPTSEGSSGSSSGKTDLGLLQNVLQGMILTMDPSKSRTPTAGQTSVTKQKQVESAKPAAP
jgi:hypothetical protein